MPRSAEARPDGRTITSFIEEALREQLRAQAQACDRPPFRVDVIQRRGLQPGVDLDDRLVHGWHGRASQFSTVVRELRYEGYRVVALDAPANGDSPGRHRTIVHYVAAIRALDRRNGGFEAIVGHSFGALAALLAVAQGVRTQRLIAVAGVSSID